MLHCRFALFAVQCVTGQSFCGKFKNTLEGMIIAKVVTCRGRAFIVFMCERRKENVTYQEVNDSEMSAITQFMAS